MTTNNILERSWILKYIDLIDNEEIIVGEELYLQHEKLKKESTRSYLSKHNEYKNRF